MRGLMQDSALTVDKILDHAKNWHGDREVVSRSVEGPIVRLTYAEIHSRAKRVSNLLLGLGVTLGDRVATLAWNTARHMEAWYGIMGIGAVCHTLNPRLHPDQIAWIINHAEDKIIFVDLTFVPILEQILSGCPSVEQVVIMTDQAHMPGFKIQGVAGMKFGGAHCYENAIAGQSELCAWGGFDENTACGLCYTSGTTGDPKGVLYSHRSNYIHALVGLQTDVLGMSAIDTVLPVVPMFHANAWGTAFACPAVGAKMVMPGPKMDGASIYELLDSEEVTFSAAVPTVWQMLLAHLDAEHLKLPHLGKVVIGGSACPEAIIRGFKERYDVDVLHAWGMTETSPLGTLGSPNARVAKLSYDEQMPYKLKQGRPPLGIEMKLVDDDGKQLPHDGQTFGHLMVKGPFVVGEYFKGAGGQILDADGFFDTGDVATIDSEGFMQITDRAKDVIKSGGEWISTIDIENIAMGHPKAANAAVIGIAHPKWDERPLLLVQLKPGVEATKEEFIEFLHGKIAKWWMPDDVVFVDDIPLGATGKIDKKVLRARFADYQLPEIPVAAAMAAAAAAAPSMAMRADPDPVLHAPESDGNQAHAGDGEGADPFDSATVADDEAAVADSAGDDASAPAEPEIAEPGIAEAEFEPAHPADPPVAEPHSSEPEARIETVAETRPAAPLAEALIAGAAAAAAGGAVATVFNKDASEETPGTPEPGAAEVRAAETQPETKAMDSKPVDPAQPPQDGEPPVDLPLAWAPGGAEPPRTEHIASKPARGAKGEDGGVPEALPGMPGLTPLGAMPGKDEPARTRAVGGKADTLSFPASLKGADASPQPPSSGSSLGGDEAPLAFTPVPAGGVRSKARGGVAGYYLTLALMIALSPVAIIAVGAAGMHLGAWDWRDGFVSVMVNGPAPNLGWAPAAALLSVLTSFIGLLVAAFGGWRHYWRRAMLALGVTVATIAAFAGMIALGGQAPRIHDVATDWSDPLLFSPKIMAARGPDANIVEPNPVVPLDAGAYAGRSIADINSETCPAARPAILSVAPAQAYAAAKEALLAQGLTLVTDNPAAGRLEATATSLIYGFKDDIVVRVRPQGVGSRIDMRSISRVGVSDVGANCKRIGKLTAALAPAP
ncbi:MAG: long-chain-fatty-acid--CoA ligase [Caulobacter sp.]|nr:long-chain-fatty-acid--CoA ligase [Caulobacter sp.]